MGYEQAKGIVDLGDELPEDIIRRVRGRGEGEKEEGVIRFIASVWKVSTLADGGIRLVLDLEEGARIHMPELARCQQNGIALEIEAKKLE
jgi:hypothetical protein